MSRSQTKHQAKRQGLGRLLEKDQRHKRQNLGVDSPHASKHAVDSSTSHESILDQSDLDQIMEYATLANRQFSAEKERTIIITKEAFQVDQIDPQRIEAQEQRWNELKIPHRPKWYQGTSRDEQDELERRAFLEWRRGLARLEEDEHLLLTPFEKNIEVWRQLWRVLERSDLIVQIVDARNPLLFRSLDLENYVKETSIYKRNLLLVNKADLLSASQRKVWAEFFKKEGVNYVFFSAAQEILKHGEEKHVALHKTLQTNRERLLAQNPFGALNSGKTRQGNPEKLAGEDEEEDDEEDEDEEEDEEAGAEGEADEDEEEEKKSSVMSPSFRQVDTGDVDDEDIRVHSCTDLIDRVIRECKDLHKVRAADPVWAASPAAAAFAQYAEPKWTVGMVGYPNVGKSSTINALAKEKKVAVSQTPGKTKHFQTIVMPDLPLILCDCPGLVFPSFATTRSDMVCNGLIRIAELREYEGPVRLVCQRIPRSILEETYSVSIPKPLSHEDPHRSPTPAEVLDALGYLRGFMARSGTPDRNRGARIILTDYMNGKLLYAHPPPGVPHESFVLEAIKAKPLATIKEEERQQRAKERSLRAKAKALAKEEGETVEDDDSQEDEESDESDEEGSGDDFISSRAEVKEEGKVTIITEDGERQFQPNAYTKPRRGKKSVRRVREKRRLENNTTGTFTTGKNAGGFAGRYQMGGYQGLPTGVKYTGDGLKVVGKQ